MWVIILQMLMKILLMTGGNEMKYRLICRFITVFGSGYYRQKNFIPFFSVHLWIKLTLLKKNETTLREIRKIRLNQRNTIINKN